MLKNIKIGKILTFSFIFLSIIVGIVGAVGLLNLNKSNVNSATIYNDRLVPITELSSIQKNVLNIRSTMLTMLYERNIKTFDMRNTEITKLSKENDELLAKYEKSNLTTQDKTLLNNFKTSSASYASLRDKAMAFLKSEDYDGATKIFAEVGNARVKVENGIVALINLNVKEAADLQKETQENFKRSFFLMISIVVIAFAIALLLAIIIPRSISRPIKTLVAATNEMANGNLEVAVDYQSNNEFGQLAEGMMGTVGVMQVYIGDISETLSKMAQGDLTVTVDMDYIGDFAQIKTSVVGITDSLNEILTQINQASNQVLTGATQVSSAAQALSQGSAEQASSIEELSASIEDISSQIKKNAENAQSAKAISLNSTKIIESANTQMSDMIAAMEHINETSKKISKIIKTIDDIAFQTNILALNAAVEAARAGEAGKGFAVVADEVRNLASKSAEAAKDTTVLIENSIEAVDKGTKIADETAKSLLVIVEDSKRSADLINLISEASILQAKAITQTTQGVSQISGVVQTNSATAQESAAASEELSGQADMLNQLVSKFNLRSSQDNMQMEQQSDIPKGSAIEFDVPKGSSKY